MNLRNRLNACIGAIAGAVLSVFGGRRRKPTPADYQRIEFRTSTQRLGIRFTERIRNVFRFKWIRRT